MMLDTTKFYIVILVQVTLMFDSRSQGCKKARSYVAIIIQSSQLIDGI